MWDMSKACMLLQSSITHLKLGHEEIVIANFLAWDCKDSKNAIIRMWDGRQIFTSESSQIFYEWIHATFNGF